MQNPAEDWLSHVLREHFPPHSFQYLFSNYDEKSLTAVVVPLTQHLNMTRSVNL